MTRKRTDTDIFSSQCHGTFMFSGLSANTLSSVNATDLALIVRLQVALGQAFAMAQQMTESVTAFQDALRVSVAKYGFNCSPHC